LVDDESQEAVVRRSFNQFDEEGLLFSFTRKLWCVFYISVATTVMFSLHYSW